MYYGVWLDLLNADVIPSLIWFQQLFIDEVTASFAI